MTEHVTAVMVSNRWERLREMSPADEAALHVETADDPIAQADLICAGCNDDWPCAFERGRRAEYAPSHGGPTMTTPDPLRAALAAIIASWEATIKVLDMPAPVYRASVLDAMAVWPRGANGPIAVAAYESLVERLREHRAVVSATSAALAADTARPTTGYHGADELDLHYDLRCPRCTEQRDRLRPPIEMDEVYAIVAEETP